MLKAFHVILDVKDVPFDLCIDDKRLLNTLTSAAISIGITVISTNRYRFGFDSPNGCTAIVMLDESHMSVHTYADSNMMAFDIFTCSEKELCEKAAKYIVKELQLTNYQLKILQRFN